MEPIIMPCVYCQRTKMSVVVARIYEKIFEYQVQCVHCGAMGPKEHSRIKAIEKHNEAHNPD